MSAGSKDDETVEVSVDVAARPETVFRFLSDPARMMQWLGAAVEMEPAADGLLRVHFDRFGTVVEGKVVELVPHERAVFTWGVSSGRQAETIPPGSTRVTVLLEPTAGGTRVVLRHEGLPTEAERREHEGGWRYYAGQIALLAAREELLPRVEGALDAWCAAWSEADGAARGALFARCFAQDGSFEDEHAEVRGRDALATHVGAVQSMVPGLSLRREGPARIVRRHVCFPWTIVSAQGDEIARGVNFADLSAEGLLSSVVGFADGS